MATPGASPPPSRTLRPPRRREPIYIGAGVAVAVLVLVVVFVAGFGLQGSGAVGPILTYSEARPVADRTVGGFEGGNWNLLFAAGLVSSRSLTLPVNTTTIANLSCTFTPISSTENLTLPAFTGNRSAGVAPAWEFAYASVTGGIALVSVVGGKGTVAGTLSGTRCALAGLLSPIPGDVIDSSQAAAAVRPEAQAFLASDPNASAVFGIGPAVLFGGSSFQPEWFLVYTTCTAGHSPVGTGSEFNATVNALTGQVLATHTNSSVPCRSSAFSLVRPTGTPSNGPATRAFRML